MLIAALLGAARDLRPSFSWRRLRQRLRLSFPNGIVWIWAATLSAFRYGGNGADGFAIVAAWFALWMEKTTQKWLYAAILIATLVKQNAAILQPALQSVRFFDPSRFHAEFFSHFGPRDFMGIPLAGAWWIPAYYAAAMLVCNIGGEELWLCIAAAGTGLWKYGMDIHGIS